MRDGVVQEEGERKDLEAAAPAWLQGWWRLMDARIGVVPIPVFVVLLAVEMQKMSSDIFFGYGRFALWSFIGVMTVMLLVARAPFRD